MLQQIIENKLNKLGVKYKHSGDGFLLSQCLNPNHEDQIPSMSINTRNGRAVCFTCHYHLDKDFWTDGITDIDEEELDRQALYNKLKKPKTTEQTKHQVILPPKNEEVPEGYRGLSKEIIDKLDLYICKQGKYKDRLIIPITYGEEVKAFETRALTDDIQPKYLHSKGMSSKELIYPYNLVDKSYVVLTEGIFDAISMNDFGICSICNFGVAFNFNQTKINKLIELGVETIYISFDKDKAGIVAEQEFLKNEYLKEYFEVKSARLLPKLEEYYNSTYKDFNDYYKNLKGEIK
jgi:DNA primase